MKYLVVWAQDNDYSYWHMNQDGHENMGPAIYSDLEQVTDYLSCVKRMYPYAVYRVFALDKEIMIDVHVPDVIVTIIGEKEVENNL